MKAEQRYIREGKLISVNPVKYEDSTLQCTFYHCNLFKHDNYTVYKLFWEIKSTICSSETSVALKKKSMRHGEGIKTEGGEAAFKY